MLPRACQDILDAAVPQDDSAATYAHKISSAEAVIDWSRPATQLARHIRAFAPAPAAWFTSHRGRVRVLKAYAANGTGPEGCYLGSTDDGGLQVGTGDGVLVLETVQPAGSKADAGTGLSERGASCCWSVHGTRSAGRCVMTRRILITVEYDGGPFLRLAAAD
jgi:methionyl-tRNA formyltransferase